MTSRTPPSDGSVPRTLPRTTLRHGDGRRLHVYGRAGSLPGGDPPPPEDDPKRGPDGLHQRYDAVSRTWIAVSPARNTRPHAHDDQVTGCPLCPGGPEVPFRYDAAVFENRWPAFAADPPAVPADSGPEVARSIGRCEVVLYTDSHVGSFARLEPAQVCRVVAVWRDRSEDLWADERHAFVFVFENRGEAVGATISHPHGQIFAFDRVPPFIGQRVSALRDHRERHGRCLHCEVVARDTAAAERVVTEREHVVVAVPFAPRWPYEVVVRARRHGARRLGDLDEAEVVDLAWALQDVARRYEALFGEEVPYMMAAMEAPVGGQGGPVDDWHLSFEFAPPHRSQTKLKVRASVETFTGLFINDTLPETSAGLLAAVDLPPVSWDGLSVPAIVPR